MTIHDTPLDVSSLYRLMLDAARDAGLTITTQGSNYNSGPEYVAEIRFPGSEFQPMEAYLMIRESRDEGYMFDRYESGENEDPDGRANTQPLTTAGAKALRRELEEAELLAEQQAGIDKADRAIANGDEDDDFGQNPEDPEPEVPNMVTERIKAEVRARHKRS